VSTELGIFEAGPSLYDPTAPLTPTGNLRRRALVSRSVELGATLSAFLAAAVLVFVAAEVAGRGASQLSISFIFTNPQGLAQGGIFSALIGTVLIVVMASVVALPVGLLCALYLTEVARPGSRIAGVLTLLLDIFQGLPTIIAGLFVFGLLVNKHGDSGFAGSLALAIVMLPLIARSSQGVLAQVPGSLREAADSLGVNRWRTVIGVILPTAMAGIATGAILAIARAAGETAPLLLTDSLANPQQTQLMIFGHAVPNIPILILTVSDLAIPQAFSRAWGAAFVLLAFILLANIGARVLLARSRRKMSGA
jgi:phosphate transport system permease protein